MTEALQGVLFGGALTLLGGFIGEFYKNKSDRKRFQRDKKAETYEDFEKYLDLIQNKTGAQSIESAAVKDLQAMTQSKIALYASRKVKDSYWNVFVKGLQDHDPELICNGHAILTALMREDLGMDKEALHHAGVYRIKPESKIKVKLRALKRHLTKPKEGSSN